MWQTQPGFDGGTLFVAHLDVPMIVDQARQGFRRDPEWLYGEGVGRSRAPLVMLEYAFRSLRSIRRLRKLPVGVLLFSDEGRDAAQSAPLIRDAAARAEHVVVCRPGTVGNGILTRRRGSRRYQLVVEGERLSPGRIGRKRPVLPWACEKLEAMGRLSTPTPKKRISVAALDLKTERHPMFVPHRVEGSLMVSYSDSAHADEAEASMRSILGKGGPKWTLTRLADRPPMADRRSNRSLVTALEAAAARWEIPVRRETSSWPSVAGLAPASAAVVCGVGPVTRDRGSPEEAVQRISLVQRTLLVAEYLVGRLPR